MIAETMTGLTASKRTPTDSLNPGDQAPILISVRKVLDETSSEWNRVLRAKIKGAMKLTGTKSNAGLHDLGVRIDLELFNEEAVAFAASRTAKIQVDIAETTLKRVSQHIALGIQEGQSIEETAKAIRELFDEMGKSRSELIAQVETGIAAGRGDYVNAQMTELDLMKVWSNSKDDKVRESHQIQGEAVGMEETFSNGMLYPLWEEGPIEEIANCRCVALYVPKDEVEQWQ